ncbi:MAG TPA: S26 family signal peptidase [Methanolinea sp.]|nr:S26 family signal peptidase [Methanolinea sp.]HQK55967.1 S26 family signal peptidase [Methanolinea sp.]
MSRTKPEESKPGLWEQFKTSGNPWVSLARELVWVAAVVGGIALALFLVSGTWPAVVTIESESMVPHMQVGDLVFVVSADRFGDLQSWASGKEVGYQKYGDYGDVLIYRPNDAPNPPVYIPFLTTGVHPIIHRAMDRISAGEKIPKYYNLYRGQVTPVRYVPATIQNNSLVLEDGTIVTPENADPENGYLVETSLITTHPGYITKGDNNLVSDQGGYLSSVPGQIIMPVKDEWIVGKALFSIPFLGYLPLNIVPVAIILIALMLVWEYYAGKKEREPKERTVRLKGKKEK